MRAAREHEEETARVGIMRMRKKRPPTFPEVHVRSPFSFQVSPCVHCLLYQSKERDRLRNVNLPKARKVLVQTVTV